MQLFYTKNIQGNIAEFTQEEARHCVQVLRKKVGDQVQFVDGLGNFYKGSIIETSKKKVSISIETKQENWNQNRNYYLHIAIAPTKNNDRYEWFLEKSTEIGIDEITPILTQHSERKNIRLDRYEKVLISAMKQSLSAKLPRLNPLTKFEDFLKETSQDTEKYMAYCGEALPHLKSFNPAKSLTIMIGPEGDFSPEEFQLAKALNFQGISLGKSRLRTETAGVFTSSLINLSHS